MPYGRKIHPLKLGELVAEGMGVSDIARELGVDKAAVSRAMKRLNLAVAKDVVLRSAVVLADHRIDVMAQLNAINGAVARELAMIQGGLDGLQEGGDRGPLQDAQLRHVGEIRRQIELLVEIASSLYSIQQVADFQQVVLEEIRSVAPEVRDRIIRRLAERRHIIPTGEFELSGIGPGSEWVPFARNCDGGGDDRGS
jgi:hypothetical protein